MKFNFASMSLKGIGKNLLAILGICVIVGCSICGTIYGIIRLTEENYSYEVFKSKADLEYYSAKERLAEEVDNYIHTIAPNSALNGIALVNKCEEYNVNIVFVLAQGQEESAFGTTGSASKTNSVWNVKAYDGRSAKDMIKKGDAYKHPDKSIEPYLKLLTTRYAVNGKTEMDLLDKYIDYNGKRYASNTSYESALRDIYGSIIINTNINALYAEFQKYKMISGK